MKELAERGEKWARKNGRSPYDVMGHEDLCNLPIKDIASKNSILFMWATYPKLKEAIDLCEKWGFTYKTVAFTWVKTNKKNHDTFFFGLGYWSHGNPEIVLLATKGHPKRIGMDVPNLLISPLSEHSSKPLEIRNRIDRLMGDNVSKVELFARNVPKISTNNWINIGNEVTDTVGLDIKEALEQVKADTYLIGG